MVLVLCKPSGKRQRSATDTNQLLSDIWNQQQSELQKYGHCKSLFPTSEGTYFCPILGASPLCSLVIISTTYLRTLSFSYATCTFLSLLIFSLPTLPLTSFRIFLFGLMRPENSPTFFFSLWSQTWIFSRTSYPISPYSIIIIIIIILVPTTPISSSQCLSTWRGGETNQTHQNSSHSIILPLQSCEKSLTFSSYYPAILASTQC